MLSLFLKNVIIFYMSLFCFIFSDMQLFDILIIIFQCKLFSSHFKVTFMIRICPASLLAALRLWIIYFETSKTEVL